MVEYVLLIHLDRALDYLTGNFEKLHARNMMVPESQNFKRPFPSLNGIVIINAGKWITKVKNVYWFSTLK